MKLFLDDERYPPTEIGWLVARGLGDFSLMIMAHSDNLEVISFDHDLGTGPDGHHPDGKKCADWLLEEIVKGRVFPKLTEIRIHSMNPVGANNIKEFFEFAQRQKIISNEIDIRRI